MNQRHALMMLLVISLAVGPLLFVVPSVYAVKPPVLEPIVRIGGQYDTDPDLNDEDYPTWTDWFNIIPNPENIKFTDDTWIKVGDIWDVTLDVDQEDEDALIRYLSSNQVDTDGDGFPDEYPEVEILLPIENKYKNRVNELFIVQWALFCDFDGDGRVTGADKSIVSNHLQNPYEYDWRYDLNYDDVIDTTDVHIANSFIGSDYQWLTLPATHQIEYIDSNPYLVSSELWHFSGWGIRR